MRWTIKAMLLFVTVFCTIVSSIHADILYNFTDLGGLGGSFAGATSINNNGQVIGTARLLPGNVNRATVFDTTGMGNNLNLGINPGGGNSSEAVSSNSNGTPVGLSSTNIASAYHATRFDAAGSGNNVDLGTLPGHILSVAYSINDAGQIVGYSGTSGANADLRATLFDPTGSGNNLDLGTLGGSGSLATSINNLGKIAGRARDISGQTQATIFDPSGAGNNLALGLGQALHINDNGLIVGSSPGGSTAQATIFDPTGNGNNLLLGNLPGYTRGLANGANNLGQVVGYVGDAFAGGNARAVLFDSSGQGNNIDLNSVVVVPADWILFSANGINDSGWIVGTAENSAGTRRAFLLTPVPEPSSILLVGVASTLLTYAWRRR